MDEVLSRGEATLVKLLGAAHVVVRGPIGMSTILVAPDRPVYIRAVWGWWSRRPFPSVANSRALALAGVTRLSGDGWRRGLVARLEETAALAT
jgi:hypothetical protein